MAEEIYGEDDPSQIYYKEKPIEITSSNGSYYLSLRLPFADKKDLDMWVKGDELIIQYKNFKRNIALPRALASLELKGVELKDKKLRIRFGGDNNE
jgi:arsenite-transporting ATPase